ENSWYLFSFPPIPNSKGKSLYMEIDSPDGNVDNALAFSRWLADPRLPSDPYRFGSFYRNGQPQQGDLAFGLHYSPPPQEVLLPVLGLASGGFSAGAIAIILLALLVAGWAVWHFVRLSHEPGGVRMWMARWSLVFVLAVGLINGLIYMLVIPPWQGPDEHGHFTYAVLLDKYGLSNERVQSLQWQEGGRDYNDLVAIKQVIVASMDRNDWTRRHAGDPAPGASAFPAGGANLYADFLWETRQPPAYYLLGALAIRAVRAVGIPVDIYSNPERALKIMRAVSVLLSLGVTGLAWLAGALLSPRKYPWLRLLLPLTVTLLPMHAFIASMASNDIFAEFCTTALFVALVALVRWPTGWRGASLVALSVALAGLCVAAKSTAAITAAPMLGLGLLVWVGILVTRLIEKRSSGSPANTKRKALVVPAALTGLLLLAAVGFMLLAFEPDNKAAAWQVGSSGQPSARAARLQSPSAHDGDYVMALAPGEMAYQWIDIPLPQPSLTITLSLWARLPQTGAVAPKAGLLLDERGRLPRLGNETLETVEGWATITPTIEGGWTPVTLVMPAPNVYRKAMLRLQAGDEPVQFDGLSIVGTRPGNAPGEVTRFVVPVSNPSLEDGSLSLRPALARVVPADEREIIDVLVNRQAFSKVAVFQRFAYRQFRSFWGNFGWLSVPLPENLYTIWNVVIVCAFVGLGWCGLRRAGRWRGSDWLVPVCLVTLGLIVIASFARQMSPAGTTGVFTDPQGRYLFVMMTPIAWMLLVGLGAAWALLAQLVRGASGALWARTALRQEEHGRLPWGIWLSLNALFFFAAYSMASLIIPYYYWH
nr:DUF2142 domain-containing protein [Chloroflexota bacterium]